MKTILFLIALCLMVIPAAAEKPNPKTVQGPVGEETHAGDAARQFQALVDQNIDTTAEWGKWFIATFKPYMENVQQAQEKYLEPIYSSGGTALSDDELQKRTIAGFSGFLKALQAMTPPPELNSYHSKLLAVVAESLKKENEELMTRMVTEMGQELEQIFTRHGVPQKIINMFMGNM